MTSRVRVNEATIGWCFGLTYVSPLVLGIPHPAVDTRDVALYMASPVPSPSIPTADIL